MENPTGAQQVAWIVDCNNFPTHMMGPSHIKMARDLIGVLSDHFPERLGALYIVRAPWLFRSFYAIVKPLLSAATAAKVKMLSSVSDLQEFFDAENLETEFGGSDEYDYEHPKEVARMKELEELWLKFSGLL